MTNDLESWREECLVKLEELFGPRRRDCALGDIRLSHDNIPRIRWSPDEKTLDIEITELQGPRSRWDVAHESVHALDPGFRSPMGTVLEEGLATWFQNEMVPECRSETHQSYQAAENLVCYFIEEHDLIEVLKAVRKDVSLWEITQEHLPGCAARLVVPFQYP